MSGILAHGGMETVPSAVFGAPIASLASWQEAGISFGFVLGILVVGFALERWGLGIHA
ncbi:MAG: hypothetical protein ABEJ58_04515 [Halodesulfurarchaeum sp.]